MKKMNKLIALAVAAAVMSPVAALADNTPDNVGNVTLLGNIVANSPMWQWTVNDYPGGRLDAKPSTVTTANGVTTYPLNGQKFIAVSAFLPSLTAASLSPHSGIQGFSDKAAFAGDIGAPIKRVRDEGKGMVSFSVRAFAKDASGGNLIGELKLEATELRGMKRVFSAKSDGLINKNTLLFGNNFTQGDNCFAGQGSYSSSQAVISGTSETPVKGEQSDTAWNAYLAALDQADAAGYAPKFSTYKTTGTDTASRVSFDCNIGTVISSDNSVNFTYLYTSAAHIVELEPIALNFQSRIIGNWYATLNVTAYQM